MHKRNNIIEWHNLKNLFVKRQIISEKRFRNYSCLENIFNIFYKINKSNKNARN